MQNINKVMTSDELVKLVQTKPKNHGVRVLDLLGMIRARNAQSHARDGRLVPTTGNREAAACGRFQHERTVHRRVVAALRVVGLNNPRSVRTWFQSDCR